MNTIQDLLELADYRFNIHDLPGSQQTLFEVEKRLSECNDNEKSFLFYQKARACEVARDAEAMKEAALECLRYAQSDEQRCEAAKLVSASFLRIYEISKNELMLEECIRYADEVVTYSLNCKDKEFIVIDSLRNKAISYGHKKNFQKAIEYLNQAAELAEEKHIYNLFAVIICHIANIYYKMGHKELALSEFQRAERYASECGNYEFYCRVALQRLALMFELESVDNSYGEKARKDIINYCCPVKVKSSMRIPLIR